MDAMFLKLLFLCLVNYALAMIETGFGVQWKSFDNILRRQHRRCQFHDVLFMSPKDGEQENGTVYYSLKTGACPSGYVHNRLLNLCYQLHPVGRLYDHALNDCLSRGEHFIMIDSKDKQRHIVKQLRSSSGISSSSYFFDGSDAANEGQWIFHDGRPMTYFNWRPKSPVNRTDRDYIIGTRKWKQFLWTDGKRLSTCFYICEKDL